MKEGLIVAVITLSLGAITDSIMGDKTTSVFIKLTGYSHVTAYTVLWLVGALNTVSLKIAEWGTQLEEVMHSIFFWL